MGKIIMGSKKIYMLLGIILILGGAVFISDSLLQIKRMDNKMKDAKAAAEQIVDSSIHEKTSIIGTPPVFTAGEVIGLLLIPALSAELPIIEGTAEEELEIGVGHFIGTAYPGQGEQILLSGHRDTVFRDLGKLQIGDTLIIRMQIGDFIYKINSTSIVEADDTTIIRSTAPNEVLTISTCYPFSYVGNAPQRYIIYAEPINDH